MLPNKPLEQANGALARMKAPFAAQRQRSPHKEDHVTHTAKVLAIMPTLAAAILAACGMCDDEKVTEAVSRDGRFVARSFVRGCGATTENVAYVQIRENGGWFRAAHTVFVAEGVDDHLVSWVAPRQIAISCNGCPSLRSSVSEWNGIGVTLVHRPVGAEVPDK